MRKYLVFFNFWLKDISAYKADIILSMAINVVYFYIFFVIWTAIYTNGGITQINNYTLSNTITYYLVMTIFFKIDIAEQIMLTEWIWYGELTIDLIRPWNVKLVQFVMTIANAFYSLVMYLPLLFILFVALHNYLSLPNIDYLIYFIMTVVLSTLLGLTFFSILHAFTFTYGDQSSNIGLASYLISSISGGVFPLDFLPEKISWIFVHLPFRFLFDFPGKVFLEKVSTTTIYYSWLEMIAWIMLFYLVFHFTFKSGLKQFTGVGR